MKRRGQFREAMVGLIAAVLLVAGAALQPGLAAQSLPRPVGTPILVIDGHVAVTNESIGGVGDAGFDLALLKSLPSITFRTMTPWSDGVSEFQGVRIRDLLDRLGAQGTTVLASAIDDYQIAIPMADLRDYDVIVAYAMDGKPLPLDDKGPLWIIYPFSAQPALQTDLYFSRCVWQLNRLTVK